MSAIAPITGTIRKRILADITIGFAIGGAMASYWWWGFHKNIINKREAYYAKLAEQKAAEN
ncbi:Cox9 [Kluyveromyces lactis]|uniref:Cytochrome c oxidase subunit 9, mitochondrial n=1 Tax=Kluyveromyces lactis (strain ATCC 8585 / CBS 2359 / DSM 70799 / NBRC 1267 / NRRL Y-1140 / WM37) TaxID=284590 RepID=COX9_KLULA|nr:uncharacterized protein KLLA0_B03289g [Kluyveromyces lactis]Q6CWK9.3 RecName: Full=Cytochrome c oxidase subunit 9, mitochondrial; AltName: Full=Cytochrome c oxidase polypeptide VIIA; Flags: Precursor [Kluyveromyces lactis NRRL Y-1140]QEU62222.1 Cox9 [Kluyveromyces lactis]CAH02073.1 KLLA0B03289p [Kluyveromyces lactis]|eukprot:XP_451680.1 uncharacterized protein KLLA0_B03289g [Kluyveromyces lactis]